MIEYLEKLVEEERWPEARRYAEQLLISRDNTPRGLLLIYYALLTGDVYATRYEAAIPSGQIAISLALELAEWDYYGIACITIGAAYYNLNQEEQALDWWLKFFVGLPQYKRAAEREALIWYNIGLAYIKVGKTGEASNALLRGIDSATLVGNERFAHGIRQALVDVYLNDNKLSRIPLLLAQCGTYLRGHPDHGSWLSHQRLRAMHALKTQRLSRARALALNGLNTAEQYPTNQCEFHLVLALVAKETHSAVETLGHALAAQALAIMCQHQPLASEATQIIYEVVRNQGDVVERTNAYYLSAAE